MYDCHRGIQYYKFIKLYSIDYIHVDLYSVIQLSSMYTCLVSALVIKVILPFVLIFLHLL